MKRGSTTSEKQRVYKATYTALRPEIEKLVTLMQYCKDLLAALTEAVAVPKNTLPPVQVPHTAPESGWRALTRGGVPSARSRSS